MLSSHWLQNKNGQGEDWPGKAAFPAAIQKLNEQHTRDAATTIHLEMPADMGLRGTLEQPKFAQSYLLVEQPFKVVGGAVNRNTLLGCLVAETGSDGLFGPRTTWQMDKGDDHEVQRLFRRFLDQHGMEENETLYAGVAPDFDSQWIGSVGEG